MNATVYAKTMLSQTKTDIPDVAISYQYLQVTYSN